jgi:predicted nucleic acid-binding protein
MADTLALWELIKAGQYDVVLSSAVFYELSRCSEEKRRILAEYLAEIQYENTAITDEMLQTAERFIELNVLTRKSYIDCQHISAAIHTGCDLVVSWNFDHMVNVKTIQGAKVITALEGYKDILICAPNMLLGGWFADGKQTKS